MVPYNTEPEKVLAINKSPLNVCLLRHILWWTGRLAIVREVRSLWDCYLCR